MKTINKPPIASTRRDRRGSASDATRELARPFPTGSPASRPDSYFEFTRRPLASLAFVGPLLLVYEVGVLGIGGGSGRAGADAWLRHLLAAWVSVPDWLPTSAILAALIAWRIWERADSTEASTAEWRTKPRAESRMVLRACAGMLVESLIFAVGLVGVSQLVDIGFDRVEGVSLPLATKADRRIASLLSYLGAGLYEESVFRLAMIPLFYAAARGLQVPNLGANVLAVTVSSLLFSLAHHAGSPGEAFVWYAFIFRWLAGVYFAWLFVVRGFGIAVGAHVAYDLLVGYFEWSP